MARQGGLAGTGIAEEAENTWRAVLAGFGLEPASDRAERCVLMRGENRHSASTGEPGVEFRTNRELGQSTPRVERSVLIAEGSDEVGESPSPSSPAATF